MAQGRVVEPPGHELFPDKSSPGAEWKMDLKSQFGPRQLGDGCISTISTGFL